MFIITVKVSEPGDRRARSRTSAIRAPLPSIVRCAPIQPS
jgi:hypothetical protein